MVVEHCLKLTLRQNTTSSGGGFYISEFAIPALLSPYTKGQASLPAKTLQTQWQHLYDTGKRFFPSVAALTSSAYLYLAYNSPGDTRQLYLVSALSSIAIVPYTLLTMMGNIKKIQTEIKAEEEALVLPRLRGDIATWAKLNYGRAALQFVSFSVGIWAVLDSA
ncbi:hypothetical protein GALMADRAFT_145042 [Galerina marginata CBS 339.88]|uniref:DUF1772 domain-containing protein n=1 Tax=Galerina marginata (strain CBS 339.88) TaxID=685588 RepID=A0A067SGE1_GALM3|nr:hypothetical protein GALMADRAFT_145042 [Galerina marginata CBS 339.88]